jgi:RND family efflux transporter MFP subunit
MSLRSSVPAGILAGLIALTLAACGGHKVATDPRTKPPLVRVAAVSGIGPEAPSFTGVVSARVQSDLGFRIPGKITERLVNAGQTVRRGQPLMRIDRTDFELAVSAQTGALTAARAKALQTAADEKRYRDLVSAGAVSASTYDQIKAAADAAQAQLNAAQAQVRVSQDEASYSVLVADADGVVVQTLVEPGQVVAAGQTVVRLAHAGPREATINFPETVRPAIGSTAQATVFGSDAAGAARLRQLSDAADPLTRTFEARYVLEGRAAAAPLGATVTISITPPRSSTALQIPLSAIYDGGSGPGVWLVDTRTSTVSWRRIQLGGLGNEAATVTGGLNAGERFVALGAHLLHQGEAVRLGARTGVAQ